MTAALDAELFNPLTAHFIVRAFMSDGVDEFLWHLTAIEAALGLKKDYESSSGRRNVERRIVALTGRAAAAEEYKEVFQIRSEFVHGRQMNDISADKRLTARRLAREVADRLVSAAVTNPGVSRDSYLAELLC